LPSDPGGLRAFWQLFANVETSGASNARHEGIGKARFKALSVRLSLGSIRGKLERSYPTGLALNRVDAMGNAFEYGASDVTGRHLGAGLSAIEFDKTRQRCIRLPGEHQLSLNARSVVSRLTGERWAAIHRLRRGFLKRGPRGIGGDRSRRCV
jgi:hypothetical protein